MTHRHTLILLAAAVCFFSFDYATTAERSTPQFVTTPAQSKHEQRGLTPQEKRGRAFYLRGESSSGQEITAMVGEIDVPASTVTCAGCHGPRGEGRTEGGVTAGNLTWSFLTKPYGHVDDGKRKHPPYTETSFIRAMASGMDPAGNKLSVAMPIYRLSLSDMADLIAYLKRMETDRDPGLTETSIVIGTLLPDKGPLAEMGQAMREVLQASFDDVNRNGGIYNRKIEFRVAVAGSDAAATVANAKQMMENDDVFAAVSGSIAGADDSIAALSRDAEVPFIGPSTLLPDTTLPLNRYVFYLLPGLKEQARALVNFAAKKTEGQKAQVAVVSPDVPLTRHICVAIEERGKKVGWPAVSTTYYPRDRFNAAQQAAALKEKGVDTLFFLGSTADLKTLIQESEAAGWFPSIYALGVLIGRDVTTVLPANMKDKFFLAFPTVPTDLTEKGAGQYARLMDTSKLRSGHTAARVSAFAAATLLIEGLKRAGKDLSRERLIESLEGLYEFETGFVPKITFGPNRRIGALGAYVVTIDPEKKSFLATAQWVAAE